MLLFINVEFKDYLGFYDVVVLGDILFEGVMVNGMKVM